MHLNEVDFAETLERRGLDDVEDGDDVLVIEPPQKLDLAQRSQAEHCAKVQARREGGKPASTTAGRGLHDSQRTRVVERTDLLDRNLTLRGKMHGRAVREE